jgi:hypothetical protein
VGRALGVCVPGQPAQQIAQDGPVGRVERGQHRVLGPGQAAFEPSQRGPTGPGGHDPAGPAVVRIGLPFDEFGRDQVVQQVRHHGPVDPEVVGQCQLAARGVVDGGGQHLVAPGPTGQLRHGGIGRAHVGPEDRAQGPAQVVLHPRRHGPTLPRHAGWQMFGAEDNLSNRRF